MQKVDRRTPVVTDNDLEVLYERPGFMLRRAHQIGVSIFLEETGIEGVTTTSQFGLMLILRARPNMDQIGLAKLIGLDRSTTGLVVSKLEADGMLERRASFTDRRRKELNLTEKGLAFLARLEPRARRVEKRVLGAFDEAEGNEFVRLLRKFIEFHNSHVRIPMDSSLS
jgi:DNA-binding MarR family transcriptional regulator